MDAVLWGSVFIQWWRATYIFDGEVTYWGLFQEDKLYQGENYSVN